MRCPICKKTFESGQSPALPFCSERCRTIDLGRWLGEAYHLPAAADSLTDELPDEFPDMGFAANGGEALRDPS